MKKSGTLIASAAVALCSVALHTEAAVAQPNLLANPSFEVPGVGSAFDQWVSFGNTFRELVAPITGVANAKAFGTFGSPNNFSGAFQNVPVTAGLQYELSIFAMTLTTDKLAGGNLGRMAVDWVDSGGAVMFQDGFTVVDLNTTPDIYFLHQQLVTAPAGAVSANFVFGVFQPNFEGGSVLFEDAALRQIPTPGSMALLLAAGAAPLARRRRR